MEAAPFLSLESTRARDPGERDCKTSVVADKDECLVPFIVDVFVHVPRGEAAV
jgi:hypothetical protein